MGNSGERVGQDKGIGHGLVEASLANDDPLEAIGIGVEMHIFHPGDPTVENDIMRAFTAAHLKSQSGRKEHAGIVSQARQRVDQAIAFDAMMPTIFSLETSLACDLKCPECAIGGGMIQREKGFLSFDRYQVVAEKIRPYAKFFYMHIWGEPMLNRDIVPMVRHASAFVPTNISTNALSMTPERAEALIGAGVSEIIVSIDGATQEVYERYRVGGNLGKALEGLETLSRANVAQGGKARIIPQFVVFRHNQHEMEAFRLICDRLGLSPSFKAPYIRGNESRFEYSDIPSMRRPRYADRSSLARAMRECRDPRDVFTILLDGSVVICCHDYQGTTCFGNIFEQDVAEIWNSPAYREFRWRILSGDAPDFCVNNCMSYFLEGDDGGKSREADGLLREIRRSLLSRKDLS